MVNEVEVINRNAVTEKLLANARKSLNEIHEITGLPVEEIAERYSILFEERGWMTERQEERLLLIELGDVIADAKAKLKTAHIEDYASVARVVLQGMTLMANRMDARKKLVDDDINRITRANARQFGQAYDIALRHIMDGLKAAHPDITDDEVDTLNIEGLNKAKKRLDKATY